MIDFHLIALINQLAILVKASGLDEAGDSFFWQVFLELVSSELLPDVAFFVSVCFSPVLSRVPVVELVKHDLDSVNVHVVLSVDSETLLIECIFDNALFS